MEESNIKKCRRKEMGLKEEIKENNFYANYKLKSWSYLLFLIKVWFPESLLLMYCLHYENYIKVKRNCSYSDKYVVYLQLIRIASGLDLEAHFLVIYVIRCAQPHEVKISFFYYGGFRWVYVKKHTAS